MFLASASQAQSDYYTWWKNVSSADAIISSYIKRENAESLGLPVMLQVTNKDSSYIYLTSFITTRLLKMFPPDFILNHPNGKVACFTGFKKSSPIQMDWFRQVLSEVNNRLCDNLKEDYKDGETIVLCPKHDPLELKLILYKKVLIKADFLRERIPFNN